MKVETSDRGFKHLDPIEASYGSTVRVYESSAAEGPHIWVRIEDATPLENGVAHAHLSLEKAEELRRQLDWLIGNHYQVTS